MAVEHDRFHVDPSREAAKAKDERVQDQPLTMIDEVDGQRNALSIITCIV